MIYLTNYNQFQQNLLKIWKNVPLHSFYTDDM